MGLGEKEAAETLADAAGLLEAHPGGMQLRILQTMTEVAADSSSGRSREDRHRLLEPALGGTPTKTERSAYAIVTVLTEGGYVVKEKEEKDVVAIATRSRLICHCEKPSAGSGQSVRFWTF